MSVSNDCILYNTHKKACSILEGQCEAGCRFHVNTEQAAKSDARSKRRLRSLPFETQEYISNKYYGGKKPWI